jgi:glycosyltransferase involved in cell wall biosynthesis
MTILEDACGTTASGLSVVIIARNEARNIARAIESVLRAVDQRPHTEILLVDSASTDETIEIAKCYPINILRLPSSWYLTAAAGRYIGTCYTQGDLILYLDGDMELAAGWLDRSIPFVLENPQVGAVSGYRRDVYLRDGQIVGEADWRRDPQGRVLEVKFISGAMLCRRTALQKAGGFQPFIKSEEEIDLSTRLRKVGYKLVRLPYLICRHHCIPMGSFAGTVRRLRLNLWLGYGQVPRYYLGTSLFWTYLSEQGKFAVYITGILVSLVALLLTLFSGKLVFFGSWALCVLAVILFYAIKKRSLSGALLSCLIHVLIMYSAARGFLMAPRPQAEYPTDAEIVQTYYHYGTLGVDTTSPIVMLQNSKPVRENLTEGHPSATSA